MSLNFRCLALPLMLVAAIWAPSTHAQSKVADLEQEIRQRAAQVESRLIGWRRDIHEHPELGEQEMRTSAVAIRIAAWASCPQACITSTSRPR